MFNRMNSYDLNLSIFRSVFGDVYSMIIDLIDAVDIISSVELSNKQYSLQLQSPQISNSVLS